MIEIPRNSTEAIARWLTPNNPYHQQLLSQCFVSVQDGELTLDCPRRVFNAVIQGAEYLEPPAGILEVETIRLLSDGELKYKLPLGEFHPDNCKCEKLDITSDRRIAIVRMRDHIGINCSKGTQQVSCASRDRWIGTNMSRFHIPEELKRLCDSLEQHEMLWGFAFQALNFENQPIQQVVNAHLFKRDGEVYRCVEVLQHQRI